MILLLKSAFNLIVLVLSIVVLANVITFVNNTESLKLVSSPKALLNLQEIFLPPLVNLQVFIFCFDVLVGLYYIYNFPCWDRIKNKFVYYQYEAQPVEKQDCSNLFLSTLFIILSKGLALGILITLQMLANKEINRIYNEYQYNTEDQQEQTIMIKFRAVLDQLSNEGSRVLTGAILDCVLAVLLVISFVINCATLGKPLREKPKKHKKRDSKIYGQLKDDKLSDE